MPTLQSIHKNSQLWGLGGLLGPSGPPLKYLYICTHYNILYN